MTDEDERFSQDAISRLTPIEPSAQLRRMVAQIPLEHSHKSSSWWPFGSLWVPSLSLAAAAFLGLSIGESWEDLRQRHAPVVADANDNGIWDDDDSPTVGDLANASATEESAEDDSLAGDSLNNDELEAFLVLATTGDFQADDWSLSEDPGDSPAEGLY